MVSVHKKFQKDISKTFGEIDDNVFVFRHNKFVISDAAIRYTRRGVTK